MLTAVPVWAGESKKTITRQDLNPAEKQRIQNITEQIPVCDSIVRKIASAAHIKEPIDVRYAHLGPAQEHLKAIVGERHLFCRVTLNPNGEIVDLKIEHPSENWLYTVGIHGWGWDILLVLPEGADGKCTQAFLADDLHRDYVAWKIKEIMSFAPGKGKAEILEHCEPTERELRKTLDGDWIEKSHSFQQIPVDECFSYEPGDSDCLDVGFRDGKCLIVEHSPLFH